MIKTGKQFQMIMLVALVLAAMFVPLFFVPAGLGQWIGAIVAMTFNKTMLGVVANTVAAVGGIVVSYVICRLFKKECFPGLKLTWLLIACAVFVSLAFNHYVYPMGWLIPASIFSCAAALCFSFAVLRWGALLFWCPVFLACFLQIACWYRFGNKINAFMLQEALHANADEVLNFCTPLNCSVLLGGLIAIAVLGWVMQKLFRKIASGTLLMCGSVSLLMYGVCCMLIIPHKVDICAFWPAYELRNIQQVFGAAQAQESRILKRVAHLESPADKPFEITSVQPGEGVVCILHIGESVRADRLGINGWKNNTTPRMAARPELINYKRCISLAPSTCAAFTGILTNATGNVQQEAEDSTLPSVGSVLDYFNAEGFKSAVFVHSQNVPTRDEITLTTKSFDSTFAQIFDWLSSRVNHRFYVHNLSMEQHPQVVDYCTQNPGENLFLLINNKGSHGPFADYDKKNPTFTPTDCTSFYTRPEEHAEAVNNAYDNTIAYQDEMIGRICDSLKGRPFVYIYISDHGELLGENGMWSRAALTSEAHFYETQACVVPMFIAYSEEFGNLNPRISQALSNLRENSGLTVSQGHVFHTILGLLGVKSEYYEPQWDLCSPQAVPYTGKCPAE